MKFWENVLSTDEKIFVKESHVNRQNDIIYDATPENITIIQQDKHPACMLF